MGVYGHYLIFRKAIVIKSIVYIAVFCLFHCYRNVYAEF